MAIAKIEITGKQLSTINLRPEIYRKAGAKLDGKSLVGGPVQLKAVKESLEAWIKESGQVSLEMDLDPIIQDIKKELGLRK